MKILVCVSQVPDTTTKIAFSPDGKSITTQNIQYIINPYDELALTRSLELKEAFGSGSVTVVTVGDASTEPTIRKCLAIGADEAVRIDAVPADGVFVAQEVANFAKDKGFDLIFTGRESIDYNSGVVGPMLAELLHLPLINVVVKVDVNGDTLTAERDIDGGREVVQVKLPAVLSAQKELTEPRIPNMRGIMAARTKPLQVVAPTSQASSEISQFVPNKPKEDCHFIDANDVDSLVQLLRTEAKVI